MFNRRFFPYIVVMGIVVLLVVSYFGFKVYQNHVEFKTFMSNAQAFNRSVAHDETHEHTYRSDEHTHGAENHLHLPFSEAELSSPDLSTTAPQRPFVRNMPLAAKLSGREIAAALFEWVDTGEKSDLMEAYIKKLQANNPYHGKVIQRVVTPDGQIHTVLVPEGYEYQEGDAILKSEVDPSTAVISFGGEPMHLIVAGVRYDVPEEYYSIKDPYEREEYFNKFTWSIENGVSMDEVELKVAQGELDFSLSEAAKKSIDEGKEQEERAQWLADQFAKPLPPDRPPVKVRFLPDEGEDALPGWMRKLQRNPQLGSGAAADGRKYSAGSPVSEGGIPLDTNTTPARSDLPLFQSDLSTPFESESTAQGEAIHGTTQTPKPPTVDILETQLREQLSPERVSKVEQLIGQYGTEEGLRRLRQTDPDAARQFERQRSTPPTRSEPATR